ncbi:23S rRNA m(5)U-747 methyltransferase [Quadrisphaera granulorum]|uniref:23S rRNA m(5)U-747 methyltransferase n=1 Tax=Quadrisphaera granulorum TaxID=317664 RepID=A0A316A9F5_9ACTN|nr:methyltransferase domain-containing protein [Quadrisphaera granulorum]PWJ53630.1 23S rRNA m(5)U-747 methyltransferase [Quadrisphaera granulorum]SZE96674.1 23S rRNA m(5)U-747 methyltransferase [Quadrisphaera granulorum]
MQCDYFDAGVCRSCTLMGVPHEVQVADAHARVETLLPSVPAWLPPATGPEAHFRNRAKMVVAGITDAPTLGILDEAGRGVDLVTCGLYPPSITDALEPLRAFVTRAALVPYDVPARRGELKHVHVTASPSGELMVRFVLRSTESLPRIRKHLPWLLEQLPAALVVSANLLPQHAALLEGDVEIPLTPAERLPIRQGAVTLLARPQGFLQTNTVVAGQLYAQVAAWVSEIEDDDDGERGHAPAAAPTPAPTRLRVWDLYCGAGGFALHVAAYDSTTGREVVGVETSEQAVAAARDAASTARLSGTTFVHADATTWAQLQPDDAAPDVVVVNPPRRGLGAPLCGWLDAAPPRVRHLLYSSCNPASLAKDLEALPGWEPVRGRLFAMFPQTTHVEVLVQLRRR